MDKIQINISTPTLTKVRKLAKRWDKSASEIIRMAIERLIAQVPEALEVDGLREHKFSSFELGEIKVTADKMREILGPDSPKL